MTNATDTLAAILSDNAPAAAIVNVDENNRLVAMEASALAMGTALAGAESAAAMAAKDWGCQYLNLVKVHGYDGDNLAERTRAALGWKDLKGEAGSVVKRRFNTWRSNVGVLSGRWSEVTEDDKTALLGGTRSFITVYKTLIEADEAAKKAKEAADAAAAMAAATAKVDAVVTPEAPVTPTEEAPVATLADMLAYVRAAIANATDDELTDAYDDVAATLAAYDARINAAMDAQKLAA